MAARVSKINIWFKHYTNEACSTTFLNKTASAKKAGYKCSSEDSFRAVGHQNFTKLSDKVEKWLNEAGLSEVALKIKLLSLLDAKETKFQKIKGAVKAENLPEGCSKIITSGVVEPGQDGDKFGSGETLIAVDVSALEVQRKTLDMALKIRGMYDRENQGADTEKVVFNVNFRKKPDGN